MSLDFNPADLCGWQEDQEQVKLIASQSSMPFFMGGTPEGNKPALLYTIYREIAGGDDLGVQGIGDCVSWGNKHLNDYTQAIEIHLQMQAIKSNPALSPEEVKQALQVVLYGFQMTASEVIYALSRVEIGGQRGSYRDGSVGAWAIKALAKYGSLSYKKLGELGQGDKYDARRAKQWGATGLPDNLEPSAAEHKIQTYSLVTKFEDAAHLIENGYGVAVCSNVGFQNGRGGVTQRDEQGFATARGRWDHCMFFCAARYDRPGLCCINQWPLQAFAGPLNLDQPKNSFWVDERTVNVMLSQQDSWTASQFKGYPIRALTYRF